MKLFALSLITAAALCVGTGAALGSPKTLTVVMHDPGCHWFSIGGKLTTTASVAGPIRLANYDEAALKVASSQGITRVPVGKSILVSRGHYVITMVGQAPDDNHLKLTVS